MCLVASLIAYAKRETMAKDWHFGRSRYFLPERSLDDDIWFVTALLRIIVGFAVVFFVACVASVLMS